MNKKEFGLPNEIAEKIKTLTPKEEEYFRIMWGKYGVLFITSKPGVAKSAIGKSIADKMGFEYIDMRLTMNDESDFKFPYLVDREYNGTTIKVSGYAVPEWAYESNQRPTIIHFEELNRAPLYVRNAALQILLERQIGNFKFNDNVLMMSSGNLGDEDGTDVEELDAALNNRLIHIGHTLGVKEWIDNFAEENCHPLIVSYIRAYPEKLYQAPDENTKAYPTPRSWTMLSEFIIKNYGFETPSVEFLPILRKVAIGYIGNTSVKFIQYCDDLINLNINDVINNYDAIKKDLEKFNRDKNSELIQSLKKINILSLKEKQLENITKFLMNVGDDERAGYIIYILDDDTIDIGSPKLKTFLSAFKDSLKSIKGYNKPGSK
jgi:hypothetical protein